MRKINHSNKTKTSLLRRNPQNRRRKHAAEYVKQWPWYVSEDAASRSNLSSRSSCSLYLNTERNWCTSFGRRCQSLKRSRWLVPSSFRRWNSRNGGKKRETKKRNLEMISCVLRTSSMRTRDFFLSRGRPRANDAQKWTLEMLSCAGAPIRNVLGREDKCSE